MFELTNAQRPCFGIQLIDPAWRRILLSPSPYHDFQTWAFLDGDRIRHVICRGDSLYEEYAMDEQISPDGVFLLPKTGKGKPVKLTATTVTKRLPIGIALRMRLDTVRWASISLFNLNSQQNYYEQEGPFNGTDPETAWSAWVEEWCAATTAADLKDVADFAAQPRRRVKYREGDFFRYRIGRRKYGYGRLLIDFAAMRRQGIPFWDAFFGKPLLVGVYHIITEDPNVPISELEKLPMLPPEMMMDNRLFYGEYDVIGNAPVALDQFDCPVHYGRGYSILEADVVLYQCGRTYRRIEGKPLFREDRRNHAIGFAMHVSEPLLQACIDAGSNAPYWQQDNWQTAQDLRNPAHAEILRRIKAQMGL